MKFRVGATDASILSKEFHPVFNEIDLINLPRYSMYLKLMIDGATSQPFSACTLSPISPLESHKQPIIEICQARYGRSKGYIQAQIEIKKRKDVKKEQSSLFE